MCNFFSCIVHKDEGVFYNPSGSPAHDGHCDIIRQNPKILSTDGDNIKWVRVEITPDKNACDRNIKNWTFKVDESNIPDWFSRQAGYFEKQCMEALKRRLVTMPKLDRVTIATYLNGDADEEINNLILDFVKEEYDDELREDYEDQLRDEYYLNGRSEDDIYDDGHINGYEEGRDAGYDTGYNEGHDAGYDTGYDEGYQKAIDDMKEKLTEIE